MAGGLPQEWETVELGELATLRSGNTPNRNEPAFWGGDMPWITAKDMKYFDLATAADTLSDGGIAAASVVPPGHVLILVRGMGLFKDVPIGVNTRPVAFNQDIKALAPNRRTDGRFLAHALVGARHRLMQLVDQAGHGTGRLSTDLLTAFPIAIPPLPEQRRIAAALDAWDRAIAAAERAAGLARRRNHALIERLAWDEVQPALPVEELLTRSTQRVGPGREPPIYSVSKEGLAPQADRFNKRIANEDLSRHMLVAPGQLALSGLNFWMGSVAVNPGPEAICISPDYKVFSFTDQADPAYFKHLVRTAGFRRLLARCSTERASIVRRNFNAELFFASPVPTPPPDEQRRRATVLDALATEIDDRARQATLLRTQKRALMQRLLTGAQRLGPEFDALAAAPAADAA